MLNLKIIKQKALTKNKTIKYNRSTGVYQVCSGFDCSEGVYPTRDEKNKLCLSQEDLKKLDSFL